MKKFKFLQKKLFWTIGILTASVTVLAPTLYYANATKVANDSRSHSYQLGDKQFSSQDEVSKYIDENIKTYEKYETPTKIYSSKINGKREFYSDFNNFNEKIGSKIKKLYANSSVRYQDLINGLGSFGEINNNQLGRLNINWDNSQKFKDTKTVYGGNNNRAYDNEESAKLSYLYNHEAYLYNGILFKSKNSLKQYLELNLKDSDPNNVMYSIQTSDGLKKSNPFRLQDFLDEFSSSKVNLKQDSEDDLLKNDLFSSIYNFVTLNSNRYVQLKTTNNKNKTIYKYYDLQDKNLNNNLLLNVSNKDLNYTKVYNNKDQATYIVDVSKDDEHNLYGNYFYNGGGNILGAINSESWNRIDSSQNTYSQIDTNQYISSFLGVLLGDTSDLEDNNGTIFNFPEISDNLENNKNDLLSNNNLNKQWLTLMNKIKINNPYAYNQFLKTYEEIKKTKRFNDFYKIPLTHSILIQDLMRDDASSSIIKDVNDFYINISKRLDRNLSMFNRVTKPFGLDLLKNDNSSKDQFSFVSFFNFVSNDLDLNISFDALINNIAEYYPNLLIFMIASYLGISYGLVSKISTLPINDVEEIAKLFGINRNLESYKKAIDAIVQTFSNNDLEDNYQNLLLYDHQANKKVFYETLSSLLVKDGFLQNRLISYKNYERNKQIKQMKNSGSIADSFFGPGVIFYNDLKNFYPSILKNDNIDYFAKKMMQEHPDEWTKIISNYFKTKYSKDIGEAINSPDFNKIETVANLNIAKNSFKGIVESLKFAKEIISDLKDALRLVKKFAKVAKKLSKILFKVLGPIGLAASAVDLLFSFLMPQTDFFSYYYNPKDIKYYWDGGKETTMVFGLVTIDSTTASSMKLIRPILIGDPHNSDYYYFDGKKYSDINEVKLENIKKFLSSSENTMGENVSKIYSLSKLESNTATWIPLSDGYISTFDLTKAIIKDIIKNKEHSKYLSDKSYAFSRGITTNKDAIIEDQIKDIVDKILPVEIAQLPDLDANNMPLKNNGINNFALPGKYYDELSDQIQTDPESLKHKYIMINANPSDDSKLESMSQTDKNIAIRQAKTSLEKEFLNAFNVPNKNITLFDYNTKGDFDNFASDVYNYSVYQVFDQNQGSMYFMNFQDALNYLIGISDLKINTLNNSKTVYEFDNKEFYSKSSLYDYVYQNLLKQV